MNASTQLQRRRFLLGGAALVGAGLVGGWARWAAAGTMGEDAPEAAGQVTNPATGTAAGRVTIVAFNDHGKRLGKRTVEAVVKTAAQWQAELSSAQYHILRDHGTERAFSGKYVNKPAQPGFYRCLGCGNALYDATTQFHSGTGWPSFWQPIAAINVTEHGDSSYGMVRTEIRCTLCDGHLGHKFHDGPPPTGLRYCMDSRALRFVATGTA